MRIIFTVLLILLGTSLFGQEKTESQWQLFEDENTRILEISKTQTSKYKNLIFIVVWDEKLSYSDNIGYYGSIKKLKIYNHGKLINTLLNIEDGIALGTIRLEVYDYNFDGHLDFIIPINCGKICWEAYYLFDSKTNKFAHCESWDHLRIQKINKKQNQILTQPDGNAFEDNRILYQVDGINLIRLN